MKDYLKRNFHYENTKKILHEDQATPQISSISIILKKTLISNTPSQPTEKILHIEIKRIYEIPQGK